MPANKTNLQAFYARTGLALVEIRRVDLVLAKPINRDGESLVNSFFAFSIMKARLLLLLGGAVTLSSAPALAQLTPSANSVSSGSLPGGAVTLFQVNTAQPSVMDFRGTGTATYSNSTGTSNSINLGSATNLGINANVATSKEYEGTASALLQLTGPDAAEAGGTTAMTGTTFLQTIGSATGTANMQAAAQSTSEQAHNSATSKADTIVTETLGTNSASYSNEFNASKAEAARSLGVTLDTSGMALDTKDASGNVTSTASENETALGAALKQAGVQGTTNADGSMTQYTTTEWSTAATSLHETAYNDTYSEAYTQSASNQSSMNTTSEGTGKVVGSFNTTNSGTGSISLSASEVATLATASASGSTGSSWDSSTTTAVTYTDGQSSSDVDSAGTFTNNSGSDVTRIENANGQTSDEWQSAFAEAYASAANDLTTAGSNTSDSQVSVEGIGNIANVGAQSNSNFNVSLQARNQGVVGDESGTASGGAGMSLNTASSAAVSSSQFASSFIQAFAGDIPTALVDANANLINAAQGSGS